MRFVTERGARNTGRRDLLRFAAVGAVAAALGGRTVFRTRPAAAGDLPQLAEMPRRSTLVRFRQWRLFKARYPDQVPADNAVLPLDQLAWDHLRLAVVVAPALPYDPTLKSWEIREDAGNCAVRALTVRAFLARHRVPLGAVRPVICYRGEIPHMGNVVVTDQGDLFIDSIANILEPAWQAPYRWYARWYADEIWEELEPKASEPA